jgi:hypothetical protein
MVYSALVFCYRQPHLTPEEFRHHLLNIYVPLMKKLVGENGPEAVNFRFPARAGSGVGDRLGAFTMSKEKKAADAPVVLVGDSGDSDVQWDVIAEYRFSDELAFQQGWAMLNDGDISTQLVEEEAKFSVAEKMKVVLLGETVDGWARV